MFKNNIKLAICIYKTTGLDHEKLLERMTEYTHFFSLRVREFSNELDILFSDSVEKGIQEFGKKYSYIFFVPAGTKFMSSTLLFDIENFVNAHPKLWGAKSQNYPALLVKTEKTAYYSEVLENAITLPPELERKMSYAWPEHHSADFYEGITEGTIFNTFRQEQIDLIGTDDFARVQTWLFNPEDYPFFPQDSAGEFDLVALPCEGFNFLEVAAKKVLRPEGKILFHGTNLKNLEWFQFLLNHSSTDIQEMVSEYPGKRNLYFLDTDHFVLNSKKEFTPGFLNSVNKTYEKYGGKENFGKLLTEFRALPCEFHFATHFKDPLSLIRRMKGEQIYINISHIFNNDHGALFHGLKKLEDTFEAFLAGFEKRTILTGFSPRSKFIHKTFFEKNKLSDEMNNIKGDRDQLILKHILETDKRMPVQMNHASAHLGVNGSLKYTDYSEPLALKDYNQGEEKIVFCICPSWGVIFPPYGLSKLSGTLRKEGFACKVYDLNIQIYHQLLKKTGEDYWRSEKYFYWEDKWFFNQHLKKEILPFIEKAVQKIKEDKPTVVGVSLYGTNLYATELLISRLRDVMPEVTIIAGGPAVLTHQHRVKDIFSTLINYFFVGEAEECLLDFLKNKEKLRTLACPGVFLNDTNSRIPLDDKAFADFSDYDLTAYLHQDGVSIETSRGCVAQCSFCAETYFWKFRSQSPERVVEEIKYQVENYNVQRFWFVDSLVNGNLNNFTKLVDLIIANKLRIFWNSYARCDGRMTKEFLTRVAESGCTALSFGVESGSQKVLDDMRKKIKIWEIENNLPDAFNTKKIWVHVNMLIGFPTEEPLDYYHTLILTHNMRNHIHQISPGMGCGPSSLSDLETRYKIYKIAWKTQTWDNQVFNSWYTEDYKNTQLHRFLRLKFFHIWLEISNKFCKSIIENPQRHDDIERSYEFHFNGQSFNEEKIPQDVNINFQNIKSRASTFLSLSIAEEYLPICMGLFKIFGECELKIVFDPERDHQSWGSSAVNYRALFHFKCSPEGHYSFTLEHELIHKGKNETLEKVYRFERENQHGDLSFKDSFKESGNLHNWYSDKSLVKETVHKRPEVSPA